MPQDSVAADILVRIDSFDLDIVPPSAGVQFYREGIIFLSGTGEYSRMIPIHVSFGTIQTYYALLQDSILANPTLFPTSSIFPYPTDALSFNGDFSTLYFTRKGERDVTEKIYRADYSSSGKGAGAWKESPVPLDFCTGNSIYTHPAVSTDGNIMIFASNKQDSRGGMDLYITRKSGEEWSEPENLDVINTTSDELFPLLDSASNLYFSSDGHPGYGGYDVFVCRFTGNGWEEPYNLTDLVNSPQDDIAFTLNRRDGRTGFVTSRERSANREAQLFKLDLNNLIAPDTLGNLSAALIEIAVTDMTFPRKRLVNEIVVPEVLKELLTESVDEQEGITAEIREERRPSEITDKEVTPTEKEETKPPETRREEVKPPEMKKEEITFAEEKKIRFDTVRVISSVSEEYRDRIVYRVQILSSPRQQNSRRVTVNGRTYSTYVYYYLKEYRHTVGEFTNLEDARNLQFALRKSGYPQAFVAAFRNNLRTLDLTLFARAGETHTTESVKESAADLTKEEGRFAESIREESTRQPEGKEKIESERTPQAGKEELKTAEVKKEATRPAEARQARTDTVSVVTPIKEELKDVVVYRVQFLSSVRQRDLPQITVNGIQYETYIYYYLKEYRYTAGEFTTLDPARELQFALRKSGYPQAFVAAFKNNVRSLDISLFR